MLTASDFHDSITFNACSFTDNSADSFSLKLDTLSHIFIILKCCEKLLLAKRLYGGKAFSLSNSILDLVLV